MTQPAIVSRPYGRAGDWEKLNRFVQHIAQSAENKRVNLHVGDLAWRFYRSEQFKASNAIQLWEDQISQQILAVGWYNAAHFGLDLLVDPEYVELEKRVLHWGEICFRQRAETRRGYGDLKIQVFDWDEKRAARLQQAGYRRDMFCYVWFEQTLKHPLPDVVLPAGFAHRQARPEESHLRAELHNAAFFTDDVTPKSYERLMQTQSYAHAIDLVAVAPDGRLAAFVLGWLDAERKIGMLEPVGTHPEFRRLGLAKGVVHEMLHRMQAAGMEAVQVYTENPNIGAKKLYTAAGFSVIGKQYDWQKIASR